MTIHYVHPEDVSIHRDLKGRENSAVVMDCDGYEVWSVPKGWSDDAIMCAIKLANTAYRKGVEAGEHGLQVKVRRLLGCEHDGRADDLIEVHERRHHGIDL